MNPQQKQYVDELLSIDAWGSEESAFGFHKKMNEYSQLSKLYFHQQKPSKRTITNPPSKSVNQKVQLNKTKSNLLNPLQTKTTKLYPIITPKEVSPPSKQKNKRNVSYEFHYVSTHNDKSTQLKKKGKNRKVSEQLFRFMELPKLGKSKEKMEKLLEENEEINKGGFGKEKFEGMKKVKDLRWKKMILKQAKSGLM